MVKLVRMILAILISLVLVCSFSYSVQADTDAGVDLSATGTLTISDVSASSISYYSATISWKTNGNATSQVFYDTESHDNIADYTDNTIEEPTLVTEHSIPLTGLSSSTTYHYRVRSAIPDTEFIAISDDYTFKTSTPARGGGGFGGRADRTPPRVYNISLCDIAETTADICWTTSEWSTSQVEYWGPRRLSPLDETTVIWHQVHLTGLTPGTTYHYKMMSRDRAGNLAVSDEYTFTTLGTAPTLEVSALEITPDTVDIGQEVTISVLVSNPGDATRSREVSLKIDGETVETKEATLAGGDSQRITFTTSQDAAKTYSVSVDGLSGEFTVKPAAPAPPPPPPPTPPTPPIPPTPINWWLIGGIIAGTVAAATVVWLTVIRRRE